MDKQIWEVYITYWSSGPHEQEGYTERIYCETPREALDDAIAQFRAAEGIDEDENGDEEVDVDVKIKYRSESAADLLSDDMNARFYVLEDVSLTVEGLGRLDLNDPRVIALFQPFDRPESPDLVALPPSQSS